MPRTIEYSNNYVAGFIVGTGRCGTTLLAQMLNAHSQICVPHELQILFEYSGNGGRLWELFQEHRNESCDAACYSELIEARCPHRFNLFFDYRAFLAKQSYPIQDLRGFVNELFHAVASAHGKSIFMEQTPWYGQGIDKLDNLFPNAKYVHIVRDGRDVAISYSRTPWWHRDVNINLERWSKEINAVIESAHRILSPEQYLQIRYEDLVTDPSSILQQVCAHLGVTFEGALLDPENYIDYSKFSKIDSRAISSKSLNVWRDSGRAPTFTDSCYSWRRSTEYDFSVMSPAVVQTLERLGYEE